MGRVALLASNGCIGVNSISVPVHAQSESNATVNKEVWAVDRFNTGRILRHKLARFPAGTPELIRAEPGDVEGCLDL